MPIAKTIYVMPNPYGVLDAQGRLAGGCQVAPERAGVASPPGVGIGATLRVVDGSYNDRQADVAEAVATGNMPTPIVPHIYFSRSERVWFFGAVEPVAVQVSAATESYYVSRARRNGTPPCLLLCSGPDDLQLEALASERLDAIARYQAERGDSEAKPPFDEWAAQFEMDADVAAIGEVVAAKRKADAEKADADAKKAASDAAAATKSADEKRKAARDKAVADAKARFALPDLVPGDDKPKSAAASTGSSRVEVPAKADGSATAIGADDPGATQPGIGASNPGHKPSRSEK